MSSALPKYMPSLPGIWASDLGSSIHSHSRKTQMWKWAKRRVGNFSQNLVSVKYTVESTIFGGEKVAEPPLENVRGHRSSKDGNASLEGL